MCGCVGKQLDGRLLVIELKTEQEPDNRYGG